MKNNIDKDIEIIKTKIEYYKNNPEGCNWRLSFEDTEDIQAIENVLSELENKDEQLQELKENNRDMFSYQADLKSELETYKEIAERLADIVALNTVPKEECKQCIIDWARNEVEKE